MIFISFFFFFYQSTSFHSSSILHIILLFTFHTRIHTYQTYYHNYNNSIQIMNIKQHYSFYNNVCLSTHTLHVIIYMLYIPTSSIVSTYMFFFFIDFIPFCFFHSHLQSLYSILNSSILSVQ